MERLKKSGPKIPPRQRPADRARVLRPPPVSPPSETSNPQIPLPPAPPMATPPAPSPSPVRLRLVFDKSRLLRRAQRDLRRCWLLLRPELATVADLSAHVAARFRLHRSCPGGVVLTVGRSPPSPPSPFYICVTHRALNRGLPIHECPRVSGQFLDSCGFFPSIFVDS